MGLPAWLMLDHYYIHIPAPRKSEVTVSRTGSFLSPGVTEGAPTESWWRFSYTATSTYRWKTPPAGWQFDQLKPKGKERTNLERQLAVPYPMEHLPTSATWCCRLTGEGVSWFQKRQSRIREAEDDSHLGVKGVECGLQSSCDHSSAQRMGTYPADQG